MGAGRAYALTLFQVLGLPNETFRRLPAVGSALRAYGFCAASLAAAVALSLGLEAVRLGAPPDAITWAARAVAWMPAPVVATAILHGLLRVARLPTRGRRMTFRAMCYVVGACATVMWIPYAGPLFGVTWGVYVTSVALHHAHGIDGLRTSVITLMGAPLAVAVMLTLDYVAVAVAG